MGGLGALLHVIFVRQPALHVQSCAVDGQASRLILILSCRQVGSVVMTDLTG